MFLITLLEQFGNLNCDFTDSKSEDCYHETEVLQSVFWIQHCM